MLLERRALDELALAVMDRRQGVLRLARRGHLGADAEELRDEVLHLGAEVQEEVSLRLAVQALGVGASGEEPRLQIGVPPVQPSQEGPVQPLEALAPVEVLEVQTVGQAQSVLGAAGGGVLGLGAHGGSPAWQARSTPLAAAGATGRRATSSSARSRKGNVARR
jgi:hypothetical protein